MGGEMVGPAEDLTAHLATVGLVAGVESHVSGEHVTTGECSLTNLTEVGSAANTNTRVRGARLTTITVNTWDLGGFTLDLVFYQFGKPISW